jgi:hypothetical protein
MAHFRQTEHFMVNFLDSRDSNCTFLFRGCHDKSTATKVLHYLVNPSREAIRDLIMTLTKIIQDLKSAALYLSSLLIRTFSSQI